MPGIFISYRNIHRSYAPMLIDRELGRRFGPDNVFQAGRSNRPSTHFPTAIMRRLQDCTVLIAIIDRPWVNEDLARLFDPDDWVRREILYALEHGKSVLPVLLDGAEMPKARMLPDELTSLTRHIALRMAPSTVDADMLRLIGEVERLAPDLVLTTLMDPELPRPVRPGALLQAEYEVLSFRPRPELEALAAWCLDPSGPPVRLVTGPIGAGKTRLGRKLCARLRGAGVPAGLLSPSAPPDALDRLGESTNGCLVVLDDAEARPAQVHAALRSLAAATGAPGRLLLLARSAGSWLDRVRDDVDDRLASLVDQVRPLALEPLVPADGDFDHATVEFARRLDRPAPAPPDDPPVTDTLLELQAAALGHVLSSDAPDETPGLLDEPPMRRILLLERAFWRRAAAAVDLPVPRDRNLSEVMAAVTLFGARTEPEADQLIQALRAYRGSPVNVVDACRDLLRTVLPGPAPLNPLQPEPLAEEAVAELLGDGYRLASLLDHVSDDQVTTALVALGQYVHRRPELRGPVADLFASAPRRLLPLAMTALPAVTEPEHLVAMMSETLDRLPAADLDRIVDALPQRSEALARFAVAATEQALVRHRAEGAPADVTARLARLLSTRLVYLGARTTDAVRAAETAISELTSLPREAAATDLPAELAEAHAALAQALDLWYDAGDAALVAGTAAIAAYRGLPTENRYQGGLVTALNNQAVRLRRSGNIDPARAMLVEAYELVSRLHDARPGAYRSLYADVTDNLANVTAQTNDHVEAERLSRAALALRRTLAVARPDAYRLQLAGTLSNLAVILSARDTDPAEVRQLWAESLAVLDALAHERPGGFDPVRRRIQDRLARLDAGDDD